MNLGLNNNMFEIPEALSIFVNQIVYNKKSNNEKVYTYSLGEAFFKIPQFDIPKTMFEQGYHYSSSQGLLSLRKKISGLYQSKYNTATDYESEILISAGSKIIIFMIFQAILNQGDEVLVPEPAWLSYKEQIKLVGGKHIAVPYTKKVGEWKDYITSRTKAIVINNPNNPTGQLYSREELNYLLKLAQEYNLFILSDEAYSDFLTSNNNFVSFAEIDKEKKHCIIVNSMSKNMGLSGWRVGYTIAHKSIIEQLLKLNQHLITCAATILQDYIATYFDDILNITLPLAEKTAQKRLAVQKILDSLGIKSLKGIGTFYFLLDVSDFKGTTEELVYDLLLNHNIATVPGNAYGDSTKDFIRFGIGVENLDDTKKSLSIIKEFLERSEYDNTKITKQMKNEGII